MGLTTAGLTIPRAAELLQAIQDAARADGYEFAFSDGDPLGWLAAELSTLLGESWEGLQAVYDSRVPANASGVQLDDLAAIVGLTREAATSSTVLLTLTGTIGTLIPAGSQAQGGGEGNLAIWSTDEDATIPVLGSIDVQATCTVTGPTAAASNTVTSILTVVSGWSDVDNSAEATVGQDVETDSALRRRMLTETRGIGTDRSIAGIRYALEKVDGVQSAFVVDNPTASAATTLGVSLDPYSVACVVRPSSLTTAQQEAVAQVIYERVAAAATQMGAEYADVIDGEVTTRVRWAYASALTVNVATTITLLTGYTLAGVTDEIETSIAEYIGGLDVGDDVSLLQVLGRVAAVVGVSTASVLLNGGASDVSVNGNEYSELGSNSVST